MVRVVSTIEEFEGLKDEWNAMEASGRIFQTFDWCFFAWKKFYASGNEQLWIVKWQRDGSADDCVIFPWFIDGKGCLRFIMDIHSDVLDAVYNHDGKNRTLCYKEVADAIKSEKRIRKCHFQKLCHDSEVLHYMGVCLPYQVIYRDNAYSYFKLPQCEGVISQMSHMRTKDRSVLKSFLRKSQKYEYRVYSAAQQDSFPQKEILALREHLLIHTNRTIFAFPDELIAFAREVYDCGRCEIATLQEGGHVVALSFRLIHGEHILSWLFLYTDPHATTLLDARYLEEKAKTGCYLYDFGVGVYDYKIGNFRPKVEVTFSLRSAFSFLGWVENAYQMNWRFAKDYYKALRRKH